jgi:hypothetical protein
MGESMISGAYGSGGSVVSAYVTSLLEKAKAGTAGTDGKSTSGTTATKGQASLNAASQAALTNAAHRTSGNIQSLEQRQSALATQLNAALAKAGVALGGAVEFSTDSSGTLAMKGSDKDKAAMKAFLGADKTSPSFSTRLATLSKDADALSGTIRQSAAISQAARYAGRSGNVMSLYATLTSQQDTSAAVFSLSKAGGSLTYPGMLASKA